MRVSVILSTYNAPDWLEKVLWGYAAQSHRDFEILVADDGSNDDTPVRIARCKKETGLAVRHIWQERQGFRKCTILNKAIVAAECDYLVFSDGDCIPRRDFLQTHVRLARPGYLLSGGAIRLPRQLSHKINRDDIQSGRAFSTRWLLQNGLGWNRKFAKILCGQLLGTLMDTLTTTRATWNGGNASAWKSDIVTANGYDERMEHGGLDRELGERLFNAGVKPLQVRYRAICVHLDHDRAYLRPEAKVLNRQIRIDTARTRSTRTDFGIQKKS